MCTRAGQGVSDPSHPLHQTALSANGLQVSTASETFFFFGMSQHYTLPSGYFLCEQDFDVCESGPGWGAEGCVEDWGLMKSSTTAACCVCLPFRPAARTSELGGGGSTIETEAGSTLSDFVSLKTCEGILKP